MIITLYFVILSFSFFGILISLYIRGKKQTGQKMVCPLGSNCHAVIYSEYSKFFGLPIELLGLAYYSIIFLSYFLFLATPDTSFSNLETATFLLSAVAFLFSLYLIFIQGFVIKQWCSWCLSSASFSIIIFVASMGALNFGLEIFEKLEAFMYVTQSVGVALGVGGTTIVGLFFFKFLKDLKISDLESGILRTISQVIWLAVAFLIVSDFAIYLPKINNGIVSVELFIKILAILTVTASGVFLNFVIAPKLMILSFEENKKETSRIVHNLRQRTLALGAIAIISWYFILVLTSLRGYYINPFYLLTTYILLLIMAVIFSQILEKKLSKGFYKWMNK